jgi:cyclic pyranopterin phosphate synthase
MNLVGHCIMPKEGIFTRVLVGGAVQPGDRIEVLENEPVL